jgi:hypothetical protein
MLRHASETGWPDPFEPGASWRVAPDTPPEGLDTVR